MDHSVKIKHETYTRLQGIQGPRESYDDVIVRLIKRYELLERAYAGTYKATLPVPTKVPHD